MIRMGRSSKIEDDSKETSSLHGQHSTTALPYENANNNDMNKAISESESMARDIKEGRLSGFVGSGTVLTGETTFQSMLRIDGHLTGSVTSPEGTLIIGSSGQVDANIDVASAIVNGAVNGDIIAREKLELGRTARVVGNIQSPRLIISEGAILEGSCSMLRSKESLETRLEEQQLQYSTSELPEVQEDEDEVADEETDEVLESSYESSDTSYDESEVEESDEDEDDDLSEEPAEAAII